MNIVLLVTVTIFIGDKSLVSCLFQNLNGDLFSDALDNFLKICTLLSWRVRTRLGDGSRYLRECDDYISLCLVCRLNSYFACFPWECAHLARMEIGENDVKNKVLATHCNGPSLNMAIV